jgi:hypothetical protein
MNFQAMQFREFIYTFGFLAIGLEIGTFVSTFATPQQQQQQELTRSSDFPFKTKGHLPLIDRCLLASSLKRHI